MIVAATAFVSGILGFIGLLLIIPVGVVLIEVMAAVLIKRTQQPMSICRRPALAVLVPAHNESSNILPTLEDILAQLDTRDRLVVIADNCSDDTADVARQAGAQVIERHDEKNRGKGYALDYGLRHVAVQPPEIAIMVDADCRLGSDAIDLLARHASSADRPVQALYLMLTPAGSPIADQVSEFTWRLKNWVRQIGLFNLGLPCQLVGTGMAFPWRILSSVNLATGALTEDLKLGLDLAIAGHRPMFCPSAVVTSRFASSAKGRKTQQQRWEQGHRDLIFSMVPRALRSALATRNRYLMAMALDLAVPPIFLLGLSLLLMVAITALTALLGLSVIPFFISSVAFAALALSIATAWVVYGSDALPPRSLVLIVPYAYGKLRQYASVLSGKKATSWVRTDRG